MDDPVVHLFHLHIIKFLWKELQYVSVFCSECVYVGHNIMQFTEKKYFFKQPGELVPEMMGVVKFHNVIFLPFAFCNLKIFIQSSLKVLNNFTFYSWVSAMNIIPSQ